MNAKSKEYQRGFKDGYHKCLDDHNILHGKDAAKFLKDMKDRENGKMSAEQKNFLNECDKVFKKIPKVINK